MATMQIDRAVVEQVLEVINDTAYGAPVFRQEVRDTITALRAALAQQDQPQGCATEEDCTKQPWCRIRGECQRKQAEPVEPHRWEGDNNIESPFNACMHKTYCMTLKQAEPLNLRDPAVQKRLASQWGYVPAAAQAEPVQEPVHEHEDWCASVTQLLLCDPPRKAPCNCKHTAPPQRRPLTEEEIMHIGMTHQSLRQVVRAVERAHGIGEQS